MGRNTSQNKKKDHNIRDISQEGLRMMDFEIMNKALKTACIKRISEHVHPAWKIVPEFAAVILTECQYDIKHLNLDNLPPFYHMLLKYWQAIQS